MGESCVTKKIIHETREAGERALVEAWIKYDYQPGQGPKTIYQCADCGRFHFNSQGEMNPILAEKIDSGYIAAQKRGRDWEGRF
jgi:hypothetical protein